jgi:hypothetical protein
MTRPVLAPVVVRAPAGPLGVRIKWPHYVILPTTCLPLPGASPNNEEIPTKDHSRYRIICGDIVAFTELKIVLVTLFDIVPCRGGGRSVHSMLRSAACESPGHGPSTPAPAHHGSRGCQPMSSAPSFLTVLRHLHIYRDDGRVIQVVLGSLPWQLCRLQRAQSSLVWRWRWLRREASPLLRSACA